MDFPTWLFHLERDAVRIGRQLEFHSIGEECWAQIYLDDVLPSVEDVLIWAQDQAAPDLKIDEREILSRWRHWSSEDPRRRRPMSVKAVNSMYSSAS